MMTFFLLLSSVVKILVYSQGCIDRKNVAQISSVIAVADSVWTRLSNFKGAIIGNNFYCFTPISLFAYPLKVCSNKKDNDAYGSLPGLFHKADLKA